MKRYFAIIKNSLLKMVLGSLLTVPNALLRLNHKKGIVEWVFVYTNSRNPYNNQLSGSGYDLYLSLKSNREINDDILISSFVMFMTTYFYICDKRQKGIVSQTLSELAESQHVNTSWSYLLYIRVVENALSEQERKYATEIFNGDNISDKSLPYGIPPHDYMLEEYNGSRLFRAAKYDFYITKRDDALFDNFFMTRGNDVVLLPITLGMMHKAIADRISEDGKKSLYRSILDFLSNYDSNYSKAELLHLATNVLAKNKIRI